MQKKSQKETIQKALEGDAISEQRRYIYKPNYISLLKFCISEFKEKKEGGQIRMKIHVESKFDSRPNLFKVFNKDFSTIFYD
jgi:hypothetical protein